MDVKFGKKVFIRNAGKDEYWLQDMIYESPSILGLGDLQLLNKEKSQSSGGRLDILLKDREDNTMYEVEVMLGETDPSHIIRTIEYWDNEKRKYPQRQHFAVLIAESFDRRYFNVVQLLSLNIPMIAIQADLLEVNNEYILNFTKILDVYVEPEDTEEVTIVNESTWNDKSNWTLSTAKEFFSYIENDDKRLNFTQSYISIMINGRNAYLFDKRTKPTSILWFNVKDDEKVDSIERLFDEENIVYNYNRSKDFVLNIDIEMIEKNRELFLKINNIRFKPIIQDD
ncbi:MAG: hypothetical protein WBD09_00325 [Halobacteriota archaeon]